MARAPSYDFERRERAKAKAAKRAEKSKLKQDKKLGTSGDADGSEAQHVADEIKVAKAARQPG